MSQKENNSSETLERMTFAKVTTMPLDPLISAETMDSVAQEVAMSRDVKREIYRDSINSALGTIMQLERMAKADGFEVDLLASAYNGKPRPVAIGPDDDHLQIAWAYGVHVHEKEAK